MPAGFKAAQLGADVNTAPDYELVVSSEWPVLKILTIVPIAIPVVGASDMLVYEHNLGYYPAFLAYADGGGQNTPGQVAITNLINQNFYVTQSGLFYSSFSSPMPKGFVIIFEYDVVNTVFNAPTQLSFGTPSSATQNTNGLEISKSNFDIGSTNPDNIAFTTANRPLQVQSSGQINQTGTTAIPVPHNLGYPPVHFLYQLLNGNQLSLAEYKATADNETIYFSGVQSILGVCYYIILKDAFASQALS